MAGNYMGAVWQKPVAVLNMLVILNIAKRSEESQRKINNNRPRLAGTPWVARQSGFTLVELMTVVAVIGVLATIAIGQLSSFKERAYCSEIKSDLANVAAHQESYFTDNQVYLAVTQNPDRTSNLPNLRWTDGVTLVSSTGGAASWTVVASHTACSTGAVTWDSSAGGIQ